MTTPASGRKLTTATNGVTKIFACPVFAQPADLFVYLLNVATDPNGAGTPLVLNVDYTLTGSGPDGTAQITTTIAYPAGKYIRRWRHTSRAQQVDVQTGLALPAATQEAALDRLSLIDEELDDDVAMVGSPAIAANSILGNNTGAAAVGSSLSGAQVTAMLSAFVGDGGAGGAKGLVPAPAAGDAAAHKFLSATGGWVVPPAAALADGNYGDIIAAGGGTALTVNNGAISLNKLANLAANSILGNNTGVGATPLALTAAQVAAMLPACIGDTGAGGTKGLVPAPAAGDAAAGKFYKADGTWANPPGGGGGAGTTSSALTLINDGTGAASGLTFDGSVARKISYNSIGAAPVNSPVFTGNPTAPTPAPGDNDTSIATTAFVAGSFAPINAPGFTGVPTAPTAAGGTNTTQVATTAFVAAAVAALLNGAPGALDTLKELADAMGDDANFATTMTNALAGKASARPTLPGVPITLSFAAADADNNSHKVLAGAAQSITLGNITGGTGFTARTTAAWAIACAGGLSKNGADPTGITTGNIAANSLVTFFTEGGGVWNISGSGVT